MSPAEPDGVLERLHTRPLERNELGRTPMDAAASKSLKMLFVLPGAACHLSEWGGW